MSNALSNAPEYLRSPCPQVWDWSDGGEVAVWGDRSTAAFASQLGLVLEPLSESLRGLPPLTSLLFVLQAAASPAATGPRRDATPRLMAIAEIAEQESLGGIAAMLQALQALPTGVCRGIEQQVALLEYLLADCPTSLYEASDASSESVLDWLRMPADDRPPPETRIFVDEQMYLKARNRRTFAALFFMAARPIDAQAIELLRRTGGTSLPEPVEWDPPQTERTGDLLRELREDEQLGSLAQAALAVAATINLPRRPTDHDRLPAGGVSDITNRGNPEQLLLSELAQEPMAMLARIATGQALYLRRESPPVPRSHCQPVLLEAGIRTWGTRRLQLAAIALGIMTAVQRRDDVAVRVITAAGQDHWDENFQARDGLIQHLERLPTDVHPGTAMAQWISDFYNAKVAESNAAPIIVLTANTDADPRFKASMRDVPRPYVVVRLERNATASIVRRTALGDEVLQHITLADASLGSPNAKPSHERPLFIDLRTSPLRFSYELERDWCCIGANASLWLVTRDARLLWYPQPRYGGIEVARGIPRQRIRAHRVDGNRIQLVVTTESDSGWLWTADGLHQRAEVRAIELAGIDSFAAEYSLTDDALWVFHDAYLSMCDPTTGQRLSRTRMTGTHVGHAVVSDSDGRLEIMSRAAGHAVSTQISNPLGSKLGHLVALPTAGMVAVSRDLSQWCWLPPFAAEQSATTQATGLSIAGGSATYVATSSDQQRLLFELPRQVRVLSPAEHGRADHSLAATRSILIDLHSEPAQVLISGHSVPIYSALEKAAMPSSFPAVRKKLVGVQPHPDGLVLFRTQTRSAVQLCVGTGGRHLKLQPFQGSLQPEFTEFGAPQPLDEACEIKAPRLRRANLRGGIVWLDSRGLLHLRSNRDDSELSVVLHDDHLAGWSNRWGTFGGPYFVGEAVAKPVPPEVVEWLRDFNLDCL